MAVTTGRLGADPDDLAQLAVRFDRAAAALDDTAARVERALSRASWQGPAAQAFDHRWAGDRAMVRHLRARCAAAAVALRHQAEEQRTAAGHGRGRPPLAPPARGESLVRLSGFVDVGPAEGRGAVQARVEELDGARSRVTVSDMVGLAGVAAAGATVEVGCNGRTAAPVQPFRAYAEAAVGAEVERRTVWEVPDNDVHPLLAAEGAERLAGLVGLGPLVGLVAGHWEPRPTGHEVLLRATASASAVSPRPGPVGPVLGGQAASSLAVGLATSAASGRSVVVEASGEAAASFQAGFLSAARLRAAHRSTATWARLELPQDGRAGQPLRLEVRSSTEDGTVDRVVLHARLSEDAAVRAVVDRVGRDLGSGRAPSRRTMDALLAGVRGAVTAPVVHADRLEAVTTGCSVRSVGGAGVRLGGGAGAAVVNLRPADG